MSGGREGLSSREFEGADYSSALEYLDVENNSVEVVRSRAAEITLVGNRLLFQSMANKEFDTYLDSSGYSHLSFLLTSRELYDEVLIGGEVVDDKGEVTPKSLEHYIQEDPRYSIWLEKHSNATKDNERYIQTMRLLRELAVAEFYLQSSIVNDSDEVA